MFMSEYLGLEMFMCASDMAKVFSWMSTLVMRCLWVSYIFMSKCFDHEMSPSE